MESGTKFELHLGDCLEVMKTMEANSVDLILCDLPYGTTQNTWDSIIPLPGLWANYLRLSKMNGAIALTAQTPFDKLVGASNLSMLKYEWIWEKNVASGFLNANRAPLKIHENILIFYKKLPTYNPQFEQGKPYTNKRNGTDDTGSNYGDVSTRTDTVNDGKRFPKTVVRFNRETGLHPTQKPVALMEYLIKTYTNEGDIVLDNCMGSGTTGVACMNLNRRFIGIEKEEKYFNIAKQRIEQCLSKTNIA